MNTCRKNPVGQTIRQKIAVVHPHLCAGGGSEAMPLWIMETLKRIYDITLITMGDIDLDEMNHAYGTNLKGKECNIISIPIPFLLKKRFAVLRGYRLARHCAKHAAEYDIMISTYNVMDFGLKGVQFIADFSFIDELRRKYDFPEHGSQNILYRQSFARSLYLKIGRLLAGISKDGWKQNITIANSDWSGRVMHDVCGTECKTLYPPVLGEFPSIFWDKRETGFVVLARLSPEKRIEKIIEIVEKVRQRGFDVHLHILGRGDKSEYMKKLRRLCDERKDWVFMEGLVVGQRKREFIARHKFSISARKNEPFGISVAETVKAGCIAWVPHGGGQTEIVNHPVLIYDSVQDAVSKICGVLLNESMQNNLRTHLVKQAEIYSLERFKEAIRNLVDDVLRELSVPNLKKKCTGIDR
jgi:glycosyltransferase involved in cell wall biosynthesis